MIVKIQFKHTLHTIENFTTVEISELRFRDFLPNRHIPIYVLQDRKLGQITQIVNGPKNEAYMRHI